MLSEPPFSDPSKTPENNLLYPLPIQLLALDDPLIVGDDPKPAGAYHLDIGLKPVRAREELRALMSLLSKCPNSRNAA